MSTALNLITAASFLAHMVVGCCWHHPHDAAGHSCDSVGVQLSATNCGSHDHHHAHQQSGDSQLGDSQQGNCHRGEHEGEVPHDACVGETCVAVCDIQLNFDLDGSQWSAPVAISCVGVSVNGSLSFGAYASQLENDTGPQLRPHLAHQVLLI